MSLLTIFLTGLFAGALTCLAVQGGLLATSIAQREENKLKESIKKTNNALPILSFIIAKLIAYTILGFLLGWFGSLFQLSLTANVILQFAVAIFMIGTALNLLDVHPIFRYFIIQPPRFLTRIVRNQSKSKDFFGPAILGVFTVFIPCGTTQAMMALAIGSGSPLSGAAILFAFILGTSPLFFVLGYMATRLGEAMQKRFFKVAAYALLLLAVFNLNNALALSNSSVTAESFAKNIYCVFSYCDDASTLGATTNIIANEQTIEIKTNGYAPDTFTVKAGEPVKITLQNNDGVGCSQAFTIPSLGIQRIVQQGSTDVISFTAPNEPTEIPFMCSMGMYRGVIQVI